MPLCEPKIEVLCDRCDNSEICGMTALAGHAWDARNVKGEMKRRGWQVDGDRYICPDCLEAMQDG